ncbi:ribosome recycling factor [candidate division WOR-1 bacterium RIFOXYB2_FULL_37_13]|uniref:Ribosome-recycling factor n=1 Tax=candidate division WOR-1 bacterium RIFOXYB2_FULL_37_13 TaxID=1802579 RepID=A0A1F4SM70_UNCSA|nr:MAG: ribosome recycling factor [candidate division WOR-1 bacterium RIFOXYB2_FULL_37_13]
MQDAIKDSESKMKKALDVLKQSLTGIRTGRATPALIDGITVEYYGAQTPLKQIANISVPEPRQIAIQPYDKSSVQSIEKALLTSKLGITPKVESGMLRLFLPQLTEERRRDLIKIVKDEAEKEKVSIRNIRREGMEFLKKQKNDKVLTEDNVKDQEETIQKLTDRYIVEIDKVLAAKEKEVLEV